MPTSHLSQSFRGCAGVVGVCLALLCLGWQMLNTPLPVAGQEARELADSAQPPTVAIPQLCRGVIVIPETECAALFTIFTATAGLQWQNRTGWLTINAATSPCNWYGVSCAGGHVRELRLASNGLRGAFPSGWPAFSALNTLLLADNRLRGDVPPGLCELTDTLSIADFSYNQLAVENKRVRDCLTNVDPDWADTQTRPPRQMRPTAITTTSVQLVWEPIRYTGDGGYYEVSYAISPTGPYTAHGRTADKTSDGYLVDELTPGQHYFFRVRTFTPAHNQQENDQRSEPADAMGVTQAADNSKVLLLVYFPADNDLSPYANSLLQRLRIGTSFNPNVQVLYLADKRGDHNTAIFAIANGQVQTTELVRSLWGVDELDTTDPAVLTRFLQVGRAHFPTAVRTVVALMGHGTGLMPELTTPVTAASRPTSAQLNPVPALPRGVDMTPGDVTNGGAFLSTRDYAQALSAATDNGAAPFDVLFFDQCFQGNLDVLYEIRGSARVFVASPNYAWLIAPYQQYLAAFTPTATPELLGTAITRIYQAALADRDPQNDWYPNAIFWVRGQEITPIATALNELASALQAATLGGADALILAAAQASDFVDTTDCGRQEMKLGPPDELIGAGSFARNLQTVFANNDPFGVTTATTALLTALEQVHGLARTGRPYLAPGQYWDYDDTITIMAPLRRTGDATITWRASIYTQTAPLSPQWPQTAAVTIDQPLALTVDGQWDDFLAAWYTDPLTPTIGMWCSYLPPVQISVDVTETINLAIAGQATFTFTWSAAQHDAAAEYWLFAETAEFNRYPVETFPLTTTTYAVAPVADGATYRFHVEARDESGVIVAASNPVSYTAPLTAPERHIFMPVVRR